MEMRAIVSAFVKGIYSLSVQVNGKVYVKNVVKK